ncbi:hypothetical protein BABINDRAFT_72949 [Babjeviella inositovora NRRL Y-12698]|uniref:Uncharacterized protein n=1 Tax=Babjeviella inositovora NRRL Y-12698 TaxID=984486 RepID=A0A1E3QXU8_9ASCO|nr:uncharacterized protein BABINDRAFT_72949 [Babjeviella inositovora NRRL Y-12698]ODQ82498.1 hypothetical protein BABINDRAFT_72949 [Babjeviella inositovora NRRL Y-12698]
MLGPCNVSGMSQSRLFRDPPGWKSDLSSLIYHASQLYLFFPGSRKVRRNERGFTISLARYCIYETCCKQNLAYRHCTTNAR